MTETNPDESGGFLDRVDDVVDVVLGEDLAIPETTDPWERRQQALESWTAILMGIAAFLTAWASFQAGQWSGAQSDLQSEASVVRSDAGRAEAAAIRTELVDSQMWLSWVQAVSQRDEARTAFLRARFSPVLSVAQDAWLAPVTVDPAGVPRSIPAGTPMDQPVYVVPERVLSTQLTAKAEATLAEADLASSHSTSFVLLVVLLAMALFFGSIATKFDNPKIQVAMIGGSILLLAFCTIRMLMLPELF
jgi:hypothetical protein